MRPKHYPTWKRAVLALVLALASVLTVQLVLHPKTIAPDDTSARAVSEALAERQTTLKDLPRIPWEGGPRYWQQFPNAAKGGWTADSFFPIVVWYNGITLDDEVKWDKAHGVNTYIGMWEGTNFSLFERHKVYWIGGKLNGTFNEESGQWVGNMLDDEVDGRFTPSEGRAHLTRLVESYATNRRFNYANFTSMVIGDLLEQDAEAYVNDFTDVVSLDMYFYTIPYCDWAPYRGGSLLVPIRRQNCRTASSYGKAVKALRLRDATDGALQPIWQFVENLNGGPGEQFVRHLTGAQLKGAVMSSIINEARGIVYFNQSLAGPCVSGSVLRMAQVTSDYCGSKQVKAMGQVNSQIHDLAHVLNTQSYLHSFGDGLDTMLKVKDGNVYVFAMIDGETNPGWRTLQIPVGISGDTAEVLFENRSLPISSGNFSDSFGSESTYHIYKIRL